MSASANSRNSKSSHQNSNRMSEEEAERQFISDLEKAKALSMESQALEEFRLKKFGKNNNIEMVDNGTSKGQPKNGKNLARNEAVATPILRPSGRSSSVHEIKPRPRPSTFQQTEPELSKDISSRPRPLTFQNFETIPKNVSGSKIALPTRQLSVGALGTTNPPIAHSITDDLISWNSPSNPKCDAMKTTVQELYKVTPMHHPSTGPFSPLTPMANFNFLPDNSSGGRPASLSTPVDINAPAPAFPNARTVFPTVNKLNRLEYNLAQSSMQYNTMGAKFGTPFSVGLPPNLAFNYSPSSLESYSSSVQFGSGMVKSQSLTAFPQQPSANTPGHPKPLSNYQLSVSAHTSPVHQQLAPQLGPRATNPNYSLVTFPRQQSRPERGEQVHHRDRDHLSRQNYQILPDKTKLDVTKQTSGRLQPPPPSVNSNKIKNNNSSNNKVGLSSTDQSLIDFSEDIRKSKEMRHITKVSVLEAFDPLMLSDEEELPPDVSKPRGDFFDPKKEPIYHPSNISEGSFYESYDPFEYMVTKAQQQTEEDLPDAHLSQQLEDLNVLDGSMLLLSPRHKKTKVMHISSQGIADEETVARRKKEKEKFYERTEVILGKCLLHKETDASKVDPEVRAFVAMVSSLRSKFRHNSSQTNLGIILSPKIQTVYPAETSVKLAVRPFLSDADSNNMPVINFTCDVTSTVEHIKCQVLISLEEKGCQFDKEEEFIFGISGADEYILCDDESKLDDFDYVHRCYKFDGDVTLTLIPVNRLKRPLLRTADDDKNDCVIKAQEISPLDSVRTLSYDDLKILMEALEKESTRMSTNASHLSGCTDKAVMTALRPKQVIQAVKMVCALLGKVETIEVTETCEKLVSQCLEFDQARGNEDPCGKLRPEIVEEVGEKYATIVLSSSGKIQQQNHAKLIQDTLVRLKEVVQKLVEICTKTFRVNFSFANFSSQQNKKSDSEEFKPKLSHDILETLLMRVCALHRLQPEWKFEEYMVTLDIYHGTRPVYETLESPWKPKTESFYERVVFDSWIETLRICSLPRESRLVLNVFGRKTVIVDKQTRVIETDIGWAALQLFSFERLLAQGTFLLPLWPSAETEKKVGPAPDCGSHPYADKCPLISIELPELSSQVIFPEHIPIQLPPRLDYNFKDLDFETQQQLLDLCDQDIMTYTEYPAQDREVLWEKRYYLKEIPGALPKVLLAAHSWDYACLPALYGLIQQWKRPGPMDILQLFLPCFPDTHVRQVAIEWLKNVSNDDLGDFLPQLLEALKHETWSASPLAKLLLERALGSPRVAHSLYWLLTQSLPGQSPQNSSVSEAEANNLDFTSRMKMGRYRRRLQMLMRALYIISGQALRNSFLKQQELVKMLHDAAVEVKQSKDGVRSTVLTNQLIQLNEHLRADNPTLIPLSPGLVACGVDPRASSYFPSNTLPLKLAFLSENADVIPAIFKLGDDLRQDQLTIQMIRLMDKLWLREGLDLKMVTFACVPTGHRHGMVELVTEAKTLREIQVNGSRGVTGSFKDTPITEWLIKHNPSQLEFANAVNNFTHSCAGYSIVTYVLGICDRHNDNIMVKQSGHLFHIDFGKFLGDAQMFGNFKRDRTPFVLTPDMLHVINGGDKPTQKFHDFVDLCCKGFNLVRKNGNLLLNLFALMASSGIPGVTLDAVSYVQRALLPDLSSTEAAATFARFIEESLSSWFTQVNFFIHNLAMRFGENTDDDSGTDNGDGSGEKRASKKAGELLSFIPKTYSLKCDGRIEAVQVYGIQKRYRPEKHYVFILKITRENEREATFLFRTYKEFCELYSKLNRAFPKVGLHSLEKGLHLGRQEVQEVAERRKHDIASFLDVLFRLEDSVSHSNLVYTFFHPLLRDQEETDIHIRKLKDHQTQKRSSSGLIQGQIKLSLEYRRDTFMVMVCHAKNLAVPDVSREEPNSYVKVYLIPDPQKVTKRKTRVIHKNCHPSFMEMLEYRMPWESVKNRTLQASIWNTDRFQENQFLGAVEIGLDKFDLMDKNVEDWYSLTNLKRTTLHQRHN